MLVNGVSIFRFNFSLATVVSRQGARRAGWGGRLSGRVTNYVFVAALFPPMWHLI